MKVKKDKSFNAFFWTQFLGAFNDNVYKNVIILLIVFGSLKVENFSDETIVTLCGGIFILPFFIFSALAGEIGDSFYRPKLITLLKIAELLIMILASFGLFCQNIYLLLTALFLMGAQSTFFGPIKYSILPELVNKNDLTLANSYIETGTFVAILLGTLFSGHIVGTYENKVLITSISIIALSALGIVSSLFIAKGKGQSQNLQFHNVKKLNFNIFISTFSLLKFALGDKVLRAKLIGISWAWYIGATILSVIPILVKKELGLNEQYVTLYLVLFSLGIGVGSFATPLLIKNFKMKHPEVLGLIGLTLSLGDFFFAHSFPRISIDLFLISLFSGVFIVPLYTSLQIAGQSQNLSQIIAANNIVNALFMVVASLVLGKLYSLGFSSTNIVAFMSIFNLTLIITFFYSDAFNLNKK